MRGRAEPLDRQHLGRDEQRPIRPYAGDRLEQRDGRDLTTDVLHPVIECADHRREVIDECPLHLNEQTLLLAQHGPRLGAYPLPSTLGQHTPSLQVQSRVVELGMDAIDHLSALSHQPRPVAKEHRLSSLLNGLRMHLRDEPSQPHARQQLRIDIVALVVRPRDDPESLRMREHKVHTVAVEPVEQPRPRRARFDDDLQRPVRLQELTELICIRILDPTRSGDRKSTRLNSSH